MLRDINFVYVTGFVLQEKLLGTMTVTLKYKASGFIYAFIFNFTCSVSCLSEDSSPLRSALISIFFFLSLCFSFPPPTLPPFHLRCNAHCHNTSASTKLLPFPWRPTSQRVPKLYGMVSVVCVCVSI